MEHSDQTMIDFGAEAATIHPELVALRRELHQIPERGNELPKTQARVVEALTGLPLEITTGKTVSSVVAVLRGRAAVPDGVDRPSVLLRGDMDGLPVIEETGLEYASRNGLMHACGHDLHTSGLVGAARLLSAHVDELPGDVIFMFQPGEEGPGGAEPMIAEGLLDVSGRRPDAAYGLHVFTNEEAGLFSLRPNTLMAGCAVLTVTVYGRGGHGSQPSKTIDPIPVAAEIILALQAYVTRRVNIFDPVVITVGMINAGSAMNIIPDTAHLEGSARVLSKASADQQGKELPQLIIAAAHGCTAETSFEMLYPTTVNDPDEAAYVTEELIKLYGPDRVVQRDEPLMGSEDFSFVLEQVPGAYFFLGAYPGRPPEGGPTNHSAQAIFDDKVLADSAAALAHLGFNKITNLASAAR